MTDTLKSCPFCGGAANFLNDYDGVCCLSCSASMPTISDWNAAATRIEQLHAEVERLRRLIQAADDARIELIIAGATGCLDLQTAKFVALQRAVKEAGDALANHDKQSKSV